MICAPSTPALSQNRRASISSDREHRSPSGTRTLTCSNPPGRVNRRRCHRRGSGGCGITAKALATRISDSAPNRRFANAGIIRAVGHRSVKRIAVPRKRAAEDRDRRDRHDCTKHGVQTSEEGPWLLAEALSSTPPQTTTAARCRRRFFRCSFSTCRSQLSNISLRIADQNLCLFARLWWQHR